MYHQNSPSASGIQDRMKTHSVGSKMAEQMLTINDLHTYFFTEDGVARAIDGVDMSIHSGETLGLVGESGSGKSVSALSIMRLFPSPPGKIVSGQILFEGQDLTSFSEKRMRGIRGNKISMIFQEPMTSLNPVIRIGPQIAESFYLHQNMGRKEALQKAEKMLAMVGIPDPKKQMINYPHQMSGGMRQRVMIAMALSCKPRLLIADEPTTALDVTIQAQILYLMNRLQKETGTSILLITHDLGVVAETAQRVAVMYAGRVVEEADVTVLFGSPAHPYTKGLLSSIPKLTEAVPPDRRLKEIPGTVPSLLNLEKGCSFRNRCLIAKQECAEAIPPLREIATRHKVRCFYV